MKILHVDTELYWRARESQLWLLLENTRDNDSVEMLIAGEPDSALLDRCAKNFSTFTVKMKNDLSILAAVKLARICKENRINIVCAHTARAHSLCLIAKKLYDNFKLIVYKRNATSPSKKFLSKMKYTSKEIDKYVVPSERIQNILCDIGIPNNKISVIKSACSSPQFVFYNKDDAKSIFAHEHGIDPNLPLIGSISHLTESKGYPTLLKSLKKLSQANIPYYCVIAGEGYLRRDLEDMVKYLKIYSQVKFLGFIENISDMLQSLDILALPLNHEGFGTIMLDAIYAGCCVVTSNTPGVTEVVKNGETGLVAPVNDPDAFAENLRLAISDPDLRNRLNHAAKEFIEDKFSLSDMLKKSLSVYKEVSKT